MKGAWRCLFVNTLQVSTYVHPGCSSLRQVQTTMHPAATHIPQNPSQPTHMLRTMYIKLAASTAAGHDTHGTACHCCCHCPSLAAPSLTPEASSSTPKTFCQLNVIHMLYSRSARLVLMLHSQNTPPLPPTPMSVNRSIPVHALELGWF